MLHIHHRVGKSGSEILWDKSIKQHFYCIRIQYGMRNLKLWLNLKGSVINLITAIHKRFNTKIAFWCFNIGSSNAVYFPISKRVGRGVLYIPYLWHFESSTLLLLGIVIHHHTHAIDVILTGLDSIGAMKLLDPVENCSWGALGWGNCWRCYCNPLYLEI